MNESALSDQQTVDDAATALRTLALDEHAKERFLRDPLLAPWLQRVAHRYIAGTSVAEAVARVEQIVKQGHAASSEYMGESCRTETQALAETEVFIELVRALDDRALPCSISFDLSHLGLAVDVELGYLNARRVAQAAAAANREVMISMEGADRAERIYDTYARLHRDDGLSHVGITVPAKLHRTEADLTRLMNYPGRIRLVKGAFHEPESIALPRNSPALASKYRDLARRLLRSGHRCSIATHDAALHQDSTECITTHGLSSHTFEFECLNGLGRDQLAALKRAGFPTREYSVFGHETFLYVLNRISEQPGRVFQAIVDALGPPALGEVTKRSNRR
jgi:proline dehydrogenase